MTPPSKRNRSCETIIQSTLGKKIILLTVVGLVLEIGIFSFLGLRAVNQATETMLEDRMTTAHLVVDYMDENLNIHNRSELIKYAIRKGLVSMDT